MIEIKDSGERQKFVTGAVRDIQEGKGRCDLMPLDIIESLSNSLSDSSFDDVLLDISYFIKNGDISNLYNVLNEFIYDVYGTGKKGFAFAMLELSKHFEAGAKKYGERNWQKGIPIHCYIDSAVRHFLKYLAGEKDEHHDRAFMWNIVCCIWTLKNKPEMNDMKAAAEKREK